MMNLKRMSKNFELISLESEKQTLKMEYFNDAKSIRINRFKGIFDNQRVLC